MIANSVEQVFLSRKGGAVEVLLVLEDDAGARTRERFPLASTTDLEDAARMVGRRLAQRGLRPARRVRLRVEHGEELQDAPKLLAAFLAALSARQDD